MTTSLGGEHEPGDSAGAEAYKAIRAHEIMLNQATSGFEHAAIAPLLLVNGGGAVAFLTLLGATADRTKSTITISSEWGVVATAVWAAGLVIAAAAASLGLRSQRAFSKAHRLDRQVAEQHFLRASSLRPVLEPKGYSEDTWRSDSQGETERATELRGWYSRAILLSIVCFVIGVLCGAVAVL